ncbi:MAG: hypothetical protein JKX80_02980 [Candidatus Pacebacteria bacterium]|nr:hypothetical protein [Candidatus Paceibacterota bacterium]
MFPRALMLTFSLGLVWIVFPIVVDAAGFQNPLVLKFVRDILKGFILSVIYVGTPALAVFIAWTGFLFVSATGNPEGLSKAKKMAVKVTLGGLLLLSLWAIVNIVGSTLAGLSAASLLIVLSGFLLYVLYKKG